MSTGKAVAGLIVRFGQRRLVDPLHRRGMLSKSPWVNGYALAYRYLARFGLMEPGTAALVGKLLTKGMTFADLGAHRGYYTLLASRLVGETGRVFSFEPDPENFVFLEIITRGRRNASLIQKAVSNKRGATRLLLCPDATVGHSLFPLDHNRQSIEVEAITLDDFFKEANTRVDVIKMDVEGAEMMVIEGMPDTLRHNTGLRIITEFQPGALEASGCAPRAFLNRLVELGFRLHIIDDDSETTEPGTMDQIMGLFRDGTQRLVVNLFCERRH